MERKTYNVARETVIINMAKKYRNKKIKPDLVSARA